MKEEKAVKTTLKNLTKIVYKNAISEIKEACKSGNFSCKVTLLHGLEHNYAHIVNKQVEFKLKSKGYRLRSTENHTKQNVFWGKNSKK
jgi:competence protein ComGF